MSDVEQDPLVQQSGDEVEEALRNTAARRRRQEFIEESREEGKECCSDCCGGCCNFRCWAIFLLVVMIINDITLIIFGAWAVEAWKMGEWFPVIIILVSICVYISPNMLVCIRSLFIYDQSHWLFIYWRYTVLFMDSFTIYGSDLYT